MCIYMNKNLKVRNIYISCLIFSYYFHLQIYIFFEKARRLKTYFFGFIIHLTYWHNDYILKTSKLRKTFEKWLNDFGLWDISRNEEWNEIEGTLSKQVSIIILLFDVQLGSDIAVTPFHCALLQDRVCHLNTKFLYSSRIQCTALLVLIPVRL